MSGHMGDLSPAQTETFGSFRASELDAHVANQSRLSELDRVRLSREHGRDATEEELAALREARETEWPYELLRFLRSQKWDLAKTQASYRAYLAWRVTYEVDSILDRMPFNAQLLDRLVACSAAGEDKDGRPLYIEKSGNVPTDPMMCLFTDDDVLRAHIWQQVVKELHALENSVRRAAALSAKHGKHIETFTQILDLAHLTHDHQRAIKFTKSLFNSDQANYPERLGQLFVVHAPWTFTLIWSIVKGWVDPITRQKIHILKGDPTPTLLKYFDPSQLPAEYGGSCASCANSPDCCKKYPLEDALALLPFREEDVASELTAVTIKSGKRESASVTLAAGEVAEWCWTLGPKEDIDFSIAFTPSEAAATPVPVAQACRIQSCGILAQGSYQAQSAGELTVLFDNNFSWLASKHVRYLLRRTDKRREATGPASASSSSPASPTQTE